MWKLILILLFSTLFKSCAGRRSDDTRIRLNSLPVMMVDHDHVMSRLSVKANPFMLINGPFFAEIAADALKRSECVVMFIEEKLCTEDFRKKDALGSPFFHMSKGLNASQVIFLPSVFEPYEVLTKVFEPHISNIFHLGTGEKLHLLDQHKYVYIFFKDNSGSRVEVLRKHDILMKEIYFTVRLMKGGPVVAFYTGKTSPIIVETLRAKPIKFVNEWERSRGYLVATPDALFRLTGIYASKQSRQAFTDNTPVLTAERRAGNRLSTTMQYSDLHLQFNFVFKHHSWKLANVALLEGGEEVGRTITNVEVPWYRSYYCNEPITILNMRDGSTITVSEYQIEPKLTIERSKANNSRRFYTDLSLFDSDNILRVNKAFNNSLKCCPYFNSAILSGLLVFAIFMAITMWGILMLFNCSTSDHFDDPNQKPLVIAAEAGG